MVFILVLAAVPYFGLAFCAKAAIDYIIRLIHTHTPLGRVKDSMLSANSPLFQDLSRWNQYLLVYSPDSCILQLPYRTSHHLKLW